MSNRNSAESSTSSTVVQFVPYGTRFEQIDPASLSATLTLSKVLHPLWRTPQSEKVVHARPPADPRCVRHRYLHFAEGHRCKVVRGRLNGEPAGWIGVGFETRGYGDEFALVAIGGRARVIRRAAPWEPPMPIPDFLALQRNDAKAAKQWVESSPRGDSFRGFRFDPSTTDERLLGDYFNTWRGFAVEPMESGSWVPRSHPP